MNMHSLNRVTTFTAVLAAGLFASVGVAATSAAGSSGGVVRYGDLNLERPEGIEALYRRVNGAAEQVCGRMQSLDLVWMTEWKKCVTGAVSGAAEKINIPAFTAYTNARIGHKSGPLLAARTQ